MLYTIKQMMELLEKHKVKIKYVASYIGNSTSEWLVIKRHLINAFDSKDRNLFSARHPRTKKQIVNDFDKLVMEYWYLLTGVKVILDPSKIHDPNWIYKPKGWRLREINHERKENKNRKLNKRGD
jgi:hypothetical protein